MGLFSSSKKSTKQIDERRIATQYGDGIIAQDGSRVTSVTTDHGAIARALLFAGDAGGAAFEFGNDALATVEGATEDALGFGQDSLDVVETITGGAIEASDRSGERLLESTRNALEFGAGVRKLSAEESAAARRDALEYGDQSQERAIAVIRDQGEQAFEFVDRSTEQVLEAGQAQFAGALQAVDQAGERSTDFGESILGAVLEDLQQSREVAAQQLATTEQQLSAQSQRVTDIAATRLTGGVTDVVKYLSIAAALAAVGFGIAQRA